VGLNVAGVDIVRGKDGPLVLEVNSSPGLEGIEKATGKDVAAHGHRLPREEGQAPPDQDPWQGLRARAACPGKPLPSAASASRRASAADSPCRAGMLHTRVPVEMPVHVVINGRRAGPRLFISAAIHGDELNGIEIIRRLRARPLVGLRGTLLLVPVVNVFGLLHHARYLPDRRDLNRSFPGSDAARWPPGWRTCS
jgi:hypothetical protein